MTGSGLPAGKRWKIQGSTCRPISFEAQHIIDPKSISDCNRVTNILTYFKFFAILQKIFCRQVFYTDNKCQLILSVNVGFLPNYFAKKRFDKRGSTYIVLVLHLKAVIFVLVLNTLVNFVKG